MPKIVWSQKLFQRKSYILIRGCWKK